MSQPSAKPSLQGVRIKARKGAVKAQAKHEPTSEIYSIQSQILVKIIFQSSEINFTNILKLFPKAISILLPPS